MNELVGTNKTPDVIGSASIQRGLVSFLRSVGYFYRTWSSLPWVLLLVAGFSFQFWLGFRYNSNETTNLYLQFARGCSYTLLLAICLLWLPVMRHGLAVLWRSRWTAWLPLDQARNIHKWLGNFLMAAALVHGACYLLYFNTIDENFTDVLFGTEPDIVRSMKTTMYEFVSEDESIDDVIGWVNNGMPKDDFHNIIQPILKEDCTKCHSVSSTMTYGIPSLSLSHYEDVVSLSQSGIYSRQFRINVCGILMILILSPLWFSSLKFMRRRHHHVFQNIHRLGYLMAVLALLHIPRYNWLIVPTVILALEYFLSHYVRLHQGLMARVEKISDTVLRFEMKRPKSFDIKAGHYLQLRIPSIKRYEWHDFSLTGGRGPETVGDDKDLIVLKINVQGDWTQSLLNSMAENASTNFVVDIRGPFASPAATSVKEDQWLMIAGGIGITPFLGLMYAILFNTLNVRRFHLVWVLRDRKMLEWLEPIITSSKIGRGKIHLYLTQTEESVDFPAWMEHNIYGDRLNLYKERPDWDRVFDYVSRDLNNPHCFVCGPDSMTNRIAEMCRERQWDVSVEKF